MLTLTETRKEQEVAENCYHCGDVCKNQLIKSEDKSFCCEGCKTVYEILNENQLCTYYNLEQFPGNKILAKGNKKYEFLDNEEIKKSLPEFRENETVKITFYIPNIHCSSCLWLLENISRIDKGIFRSQINFPKKELTLFFNEKKISLRHVVEILDSIGYPPQINLDHLHKKIKSIDKTIYYKLGIAGFCFGNIMMLSFPDYLGLDGIGTSFGNFFGYVSILLSLPVFFYCASDYFTSSLNGIKNGVINIDLPIGLGLAGVFVRSLYEIISSTGAGYLDSFSGLVFFLLIGKWLQKRTFEAISFERDYLSYFPVAVTKISQNKEESIPVDQLKRGDRILVRNNELIPADGRIIQGKGDIDYSFVTGEAVPVFKNTGAEVFAGGRQKGEVMEIEIEKDVSQSYFTQLWNQDVFKKDEKANLFTFANTVGKVFTIAVLITGISTFIYWWNVKPENAVFSFVSVLIVFCPCTLALAIPFCFSNALKILGKKGFYLKNTETVESLANINNIIFDKTGTITSSEWKNIPFIGKELNEEEKNIVKSLTRHSSHPLSKIIFNSLSDSKPLLITSFEEIQGKGIEAIVNNKKIKLGSPEYTGFPKEEGKGSRVYLSINKKNIGYFEIPNKIRKGLPELIQKLSLKYNLHLLSGDQSMEKNEMKKLFHNENKIHFNMDPSDKLEYVKSIQSKGKKVLMVGDGLNDAGALKQSDAGISVSDNVYNFSPACDAIISSEKLNQLDNFISYCKGCTNIVKVSLLISLTYNIIGLYFAMSAQLNPLIAAILMPASSISVVLFVIFSGNLLAKRKQLL